MAIHRYNYYLQRENTDIQLRGEFADIQQWADENRMLLNLSKTKEIFGQRKRPFVLSSALARSSICLLYTSDAADE